MKISLLDDRDVDDQDSENESENDNCSKYPRHECAEDAFGQNFHRMFDAFFTGKHPFFCPEGRAWNPPTDIFETDDALHIKIEVAGLREQDIEVKVNQDYLMIRGHRGDDSRLSNARFHLMEIHYGSFERIIRLPHTVEVKSITATLQNGFLIVVVPRDRTVSESDYRIEIE